MSNGRNDDSLGYGKPPRWGQFRKGKSGNPKGRPRKKSVTPDTSASSSALDDILRTEFAREVTAVEGGRARQFSMVELAARAQLAAAAKGNPIAQRDVLRQARELEVRDAQRARAAEDEKQADYELIASWKRTLARQLKEAEVAGRPPEREFPHPDDIILFPETQSWRLRGPLDSQDLPRFERYRAWRDLLFVKAELDRKTSKPRNQYKSIWDIWIAFDILLPLRWQITARDFTDLLLRFDALRVRQLRALLANCEDQLQASTPPRMSREMERQSAHATNLILRPILQANGYHSLAEFESIHGTTMP